MKNEEKVSSKEKLELQSTFLCAEFGNEEAMTVILEGEIRAFIKLLATKQRH